MPSILPNLDHSDPPDVIICNIDSKSRGRTNSNGSLNASTRTTPPLILVLSLEEKSQSVETPVFSHLVVGVQGG